MKGAVSYTHLDVYKRQEEERQANISLGMKKAEYGAENFISEDSRKSFLEAMESIAKLASAGKADKMCIRDSYCCYLPFSEQL